MIDLLFIPDLKTIEPAQENESDMMFKVEAIEQPERCHHTTGNYGVDCSTLIKKLEKGNL